MDREQESTNSKVALADATDLQGAARGDKSAETVAKQFQDKWQKQFYARAQEMKDPGIREDPFLKPMAIVNRVQDLLIGFYADVKETGLQSTDFGEPVVKLTEPTTRYHTCNPFFNAATSFEFIDGYLAAWQNIKDGTMAQQGFPWELCPENMKEMINSALEKKKLVDAVATEKVDLTGRGRAQTSRRSTN